MYTIKRQVSSTNVDKNNKLYLHEAFNFMLDICTFHMEDIDELNYYFTKNGYAAFLKAIQIDIIKIPEYREELIITDEIYSGKGIYGLRGIEIKNIHDEIFYKAHFTGVFVNKETGLPIKLPDEICQLAEINGQKLQMELEPRKINIPENNIKKTIFLDVPKTFIDINQHMNSTYYLRLAEDILDEDYNYKRVRIEYKMQVKQGEKIRVDLINSVKPCVCIYEDKDNTHLATIEFS